MSSNKGKIGVIACQQTASVFFSHFLTYFHIATAVDRNEWRESRHNLAKSDWTYHIIVFTKLKTVYNLHSQSKWLQFVCHQFDQRLP